MRNDRTKVPPRSPEPPVLHARVQIHLLVQLNKHTCVPTNMCTQPCMSTTMHVRDMCVCPCMPTHVSTHGHRHGHMETSMTTTIHAHNMGAHTMRCCKHACTRFRTNCTEVICSQTSNLPKSLRKQTCLSSLLQ